MVSRSRYAETWFNMLATESGVCVIMSTRPYTDRQSLGYSLL